jgi:hypothetical protein
MRLKVLYLGLIASLASTSLLLAQANKEEQSFGIFHVSCSTDRMTDIRSCLLSLHPPPQFYIENRTTIFVVFLYPGDANVATAGFIGRMRVDKNPPISGDCLTLSDGTCLFNDKKENARFLTELETGKSLALEIGTKVFDFDLSDYSKALSAYNAIKKPAAPEKPEASATPPATTPPPQIPNHYRLLRQLNSEPRTLPRPLAPQVFDLRHSMQRRVHA